MRCRNQLLAGIACLTACRPAVEDTPEGAYRAFAAAANKGDDKLAFAQLTTPTQQALRGRLAGVGAASGGSMGEDAPGFVFRGGHGPPITAVHLLKKQQDRATVAVTAQEQTREVNLVREGSDWRIELPAVQTGPR